MRKFTASVIALAAIVGGCASPKTGSVQAGSVTSSSTPTTSTTTEPTSAPPPPTTTTSEDDGTLAFGQTFAWEDGLSITVSKPARYKPSDVAAGTEGFTKFLLFTVTVLNRTGKPFDPTGVYVTAQSGGTEASAVYDGDIGGPPSTKILNGRKVSFKVAFGVADAADVVLQVTPQAGGIEYDDAIWTS